MDKINQIWQSWHTVELIGRGGFGEVYKAKREQLGEAFYSAVKIIQIPKEENEIKEMIADGHTSESVRYYYESVVKGLMNEIKVMDTLKSAANIVNIEEFEIREREDSIGWDAYIRMELLQNLNDYRKDHMMGQNEVAKLGTDLCEALVCCEKSYIIHRDIKPSNIFVDKYGTFKLGDFGIARQMEKTQSTLSRKGTELYMAPEIRFAQSGSTYNVDIYSLGLVMYRLLNRNRMPFEPIDKELMSYQEREEALLRRLKGEAIPFLADCDARLGEIIRKACEYDKAKRYQSAKEMKEELAAWIRKETLGKKLAEKGARQGKTPLKNKEEKGVRQSGAFQKKEGKIPEKETAEETTMAAFGSIEKKEEPTPAKKVKSTPEKKTEPAPDRKDGEDIHLNKIIGPGQKNAYIVNVGERIWIDIPENVKDGHVICVNGKGKPGENGGKAGDLYVHLTVRQSETEKKVEKKTEGKNTSQKAVRHRKDGEDIHISKTISPGQEKAYVTEVEERIYINISKNVKDGDVICVNGKGKPGENGGKAGDLYIHLTVRQSETEKKTEEKNTSPQQKNVSQQEKSKSDTQKKGYVTKRFADMDFYFWIGLIAAFIAVFTTGIPIGFLFAALYGIGLLFMEKSLVILSTLFCGVGFFCMGAMVLAGIFTLLPFTPVMIIGGLADLIFAWAVGAVAHDRAKYLKNNGNMQSEKKK